MTLALSREDARVLKKHLFRMHGFRASDYGLSDPEQLSDVHEMLHLADYTMPPHRHNEDGTVVLKHDEKFLPDLVSRVTGEKE